MATSLAPEGRIRTHRLASNPRSLFIAAFLLVLLGTVAGGLGALIIVGAGYWLAGCILAGLSVLAAPLLRRRQRPH